MTTSAAQSAALAANGTSQSRGGSATTQSLTGGQSITETFDQFLLLLTTQLKNQDPLSPLDTAQFTQQLVGFSQVEQQIAGNKKLDDLLAAYKTSETLAASNYLDKYVEIEGDDLVKQDGQGRLAFALEAPATTLRVRITTSTGQVVREYDHTVAKGGLNRDGKRQEIVWDGKDSAGNVVPDGSYKISVVALDAQEQNIGAVTSMTGKVTGLAVNDEQGTLLSFGDLNRSINGVISVKKAI